MASIFRARRQREGESRGKILRGRRTPPPASPYARPENPPSSPYPSSPSLSRSPGWFQGLISGAGKLISAVFRSKGTLSTSSSDYSSDGEISLSSDDKEDVEASPKPLHELNQGGNRPSSIRNCMEGSGAVVSRSKSKLAIEQLLMQETFTRDECNKLTEIIKSRAMESPFTEIVDDGAQKETSNRATGGAIAFSEAWRSLNQDKKLPESIQYSASKLNAISPGSSAVQACTPDLHDTAIMEVKKWLEEKKQASSSPDLHDTTIMEAKKWLEEKKQASNSKRDPDYGPCTVNADMIQYGIEGGSGSPIELAKSYMRSLPPWQSLSLHGTGFKTPPPSQMHLYRDETAYATLNHSWSSSKVLKRSSLSAGLWDTIDEARRVRLKLTDDIMEILKLNQLDSSSRLFGKETSKISLGDVERDCTALGVDHHSNSLEPTEVSSASPKLSAELNAENLCSKGALELTGQKSAEVNPLSETGNVTSINIISEPEEAPNAVQLTNKSSLPDTNLLRSVNSIEGGPESSNCDFLNLEKNKEHRTELSHNEVQDGGIDVSHESLILASKSVEHSGNPFSEAKLVTSEGNNSAAPSNADGAANHDNNHTYSIQTVPEVLGTLEANDSPQLNLDPGLKEPYSIADSRPLDGNPQIQKEADGSTQKISATGSYAESNANSELETVSKGHDSYTNSNDDDGEPATAGISEGTHELQNESATDISADHSANRTGGKSRNDTTMKSIERMLTEPKPSARRGRRKAVVKAKRGRGAK